MTLKQYLALMTLGTVICWIALVFVIFNLDPYQSGFLGFMFFYSSLFLSVLGTVSVLGFLIRRKILKDDEIVFRHVKKTFRQAILVAIFVTVVLLMQQLRLLTWWNFILLSLLFIVLEGLVFVKPPRPDVYV